MIYLPDGVQDFLPEEYKFKRKIEEKFREIFIRFGYQEIMLLLLNIAIIFLFCLMKTICTDFSTKREIY